MSRRLHGKFKLHEHQTTVRLEFVAGLSSFLTAAYIVVVNSTILSSVGIPYEAAIIATVLSCVTGCLIMALWANAPLMMIPGMGDNAFFVYTLVLSLGLAWKQALAAVFIAGVVFLIISVTRSADYLLQAIPASLVHAMVSGIGMFITFIGLQNSGLITANPDTLIGLGELDDPRLIVSCITLVVMLVLFVQNRNGSFIIGIAAGTLAGVLLGITEVRSSDYAFLTFEGYGRLFGALDFSGIRLFEFWVGVFSLVILIVFQNMGTQLGLLSDPAGKFRRAYQAAAFSILSAAWFGSSSTVTSAESAAGIAAGGRTGLTSLIAGLLFLPALFLMPLLRIIPASAVAPVLIIVGSLMMGKLKAIHFEDRTEGFSAYFMMLMILLTFNVANGIAFGFIGYVIMKTASGRLTEISPLMGAVTALFLLYFIIGAT